MNKYVMISIWGFVGATSRFFIKSIQVYNNSLIPIDTLSINIIGSFLLAFILSCKLDINENIKLGITTGFCGAFTTFSTMCKEISTLINMNKYCIAIVYTILSVGCGVFASYCGYKLAGLTTQKLNDYKRSN